MIFDEFADLLEKQYLREFLKIDHPDQEKLEFLDRLIAKIRPIELSNRFDKEIFYDRLITKIDLQTKRHQNELIMKAAMIAIVLGIGGNSICQAATGNSVFYYLKKATDKITEFNIIIDDDKSKSTEIDSKEGEVIEFKEKEVSSWEEAMALCPWDFQFPNEEKLDYVKRNLSVLLDGGKGVSITAQYEGKNGLYYTIVIENYEGAKGIEQYELDEGAKKINSEQINRMKAVFYKTQDEVISIVFDDKNIYEITGNSTHQDIRNIVRDLSQ